MAKNASRVGVIGAGLMGVGVTQCLLTAGYSVILCDNDPTVLAGVNEQLNNAMRLQMMLGHINVSNICTDEQLILTEDIVDVKQASFVIENIHESFIKKKEVYNNLDAICNENCIFLANTSCLSITKLAACTKRPDKVIGTHFMNPVYLIDTVEVIRGYHTTDETVELIGEFLNSIGKKQIIVDDRPGFISNRISHLMINEAAFLLEESVADAQSIDAIFKQCFGHKMGPLETADLIGLDTVVMSLDVLYESYHDSKFRCCPLLRKMVDAGLCGKKSHKGFYTYQ